MATLAETREDGGEGLGRPASENTPAPSTVVTPALSILSALVTFAILQIIAFSLAGGFDYPLDDPYIHLAIAEQIAAGGYGVNGQELSSPGSSALYPLLLLPFHGTELHRFLPLVWNVVGLVLAAYVWGRLLAEAGWCRRSWRPAGIAAALLGPVAFMIPMVAMLGMEHVLHSATALAILLGLHRHLSGQGGVTLIVVAAFLGTALRMEGAALALLAGAALMLTGKRGAGATTIVVGLLPIGLFAAWLMSLGLDPTPSSVKAKLAISESDNFLQRRGEILAMNLRALPGMLIAALAVATLGLSRLSERIKNSGWAIFAGVVVLAAFAHLAFGQIGWLNRYENYVLVATAAGFLALLPRAYAAGPDRRALLSVALVLAGGFAAYKTPLAVMDLTQGVRVIHLQQGQMATFAKAYLDTDVAVNDLGWVAFQNPNYVLDLWGLASDEARVRRIENPSPGWTGELTDAKGVPVAMIYDHWFDDGQTGADWVRLGWLNVTVDGGFIGGYAVAFYATHPEHAPMLEAAIEAWEPTLLPNSQFVWDRAYEREDEP
ncbi:hypothetical protein [Maritimibacter sp. DP1N21-5]|uniref:hypothetical protein n=1 Tax=Maritimibacter sp. DP1N21-5 TaxID=2836867 RepID=UPI001C47C06B|nr:hypothetical protein [Maritimibacter sp. DP1N21-5]MBV7409084.1 hypothetical protein [Maritimibacter sp. DP1N21-5]